jgi:hypothetical protein
MEQTITINITRFENKPYEIQMTLSDVANPERAVVKRQYQKKNKTVKTQTENSPV